MTGVGPEWSYLRCREGASCSTVLESSSRMKVVPAQSELDMGSGQRQRASSERTRNVVEAGVLENPETHGCGSG